jgi:uroporphyrinogen decarboxylase
MTGKQRMLKTLRFEEPDRPPHWEQMFEVEYEAFGLRFPDRNSWAGCSAAEKQAQIATCMKIYERIVERYHWDALMVFWPWGDPDGVRAAKATFGGDLLIGSVPAGGVWSIDSVSDWLQFATDLHENRAALHEEAERRCRLTLENSDRLLEAGADFIDLPYDVGFNAGPFISPKDFRELVTPYLARIVAHIREQGAIALFHSDGYLMPVLDQILAAAPNMLHSIDPMAGMDIAEVKRLTYGKFALMGNVQCNLLQDGPLERIRESTLYCLEHASPGGGYVFSTSNTIFPGMPLEHYEYMLSVFDEFNRNKAGGHQ